MPGFLDSKLSTCLYFTVLTLLLLEAESDKLFKDLCKIKELISESIFFTKDMILKQIANTKTSAIGLLNLRQETMGVIRLV